VATAAILLSTIDCALAPDETVPEYINSLLSKYNEINEKEYLDYKFEGITVESPVFSGELEYYAALYTKEMFFIEETIPNRFYFSKLPDGSSSKSFSIITSDGSYTVELTAMTMAVLDNSLTYDKAISIAVEYVNTYDSSSACSDYKKIGDYTLIWYLTHENDYVLNVMYKSEINVPVNKSLYHKSQYLDFVDIKEPREKIYLRGQVEKQYPEYSGPILYEVIEFTADGNRYRAQFTYPQVLEKFVVGKEYTFYGSVMYPVEYGYACLLLDYFEE
jgi:hypothetical protein